LYQDIKSVKETNFYKKYLENREKLSENQKITIDKELFEAVLNGDYYKSRTFNQTWGKYTF